MNNVVFILLGSNLGDRSTNLAIARQEISRLIGASITTSSIFKTAAWGNPNQPDFYNQVIKLNTVLPPEEVLINTRAIENEMGRIRQEKWEPRIIDIDILFYGNRILNGPELTIPHPQIPNRRFTLLPLHQIASDFMHPSLQKSIKQLLEECTDSLEVERIQ